MLIAVILMMPALFTKKKKLIVSQQNVLGFLSSELATAC